MTKTRPGMKIVHAFPKGEIVVSLVTHKGRLLCATTSRVYEIQGDKLAPLRIEPVKSRTE